MAWQCTIGILTANPLPSSRAVEQIIYAPEIVIAHHSPTAQNVCPDIPIGSCSFWNHTSKNRNNNSVSKKPQKNWVFANNCTPRNRLYTMPRDAPFQTRRMDAITRNVTSVVFFGSSHIRELYFAFIRLHRGMSFAAPLEKTVKQVMNGAKPHSLRICDPNRTGYKNGTYGVDLYNCGVPGKRMVPELGANVAIGFKTFLHTPVADDLFVDWLERNKTGLRHPKVIITDVGVWGPRGERVFESLNYTLTLDEEIDHNLQWLRKAFPDTVVIFIMEHQYYDVGVEPWVNPKMEEFVKKDPKAVLLRKNDIMRDLPSAMRCNHGCSGPVLTVVAHLILDWLEDASHNDGYQQCLPSARYERRRIL